MTGKGFWDSVLIKLAETGSGFIPTAKAQDIITTSSINIIDKKIQEFQITSKVTRELEPLIAVTVPLTPSSATLDISHTSATIPKWYAFGRLQTTAPFLGSNIVKFAKERKMMQNGSYVQGTARYPKYYITSGVINLEPTTISSCVLTYFTTPFAIDITDNTIDIPYNIKLIELIMMECMINFGVDNRDMTSYQLGQSQENANQ